MALRKYGAKDGKITGTEDASVAGDGIQVTAMTTGWGADDDQALQAENEAADGA
jgi:hypothetical protein